MLVGIAIAGAVLVWWVGAFFLQRSMLFPRSAARPHLEMRRMHPDLVDLSVDAAGGKVEAWFLPAPGATAEHRSGLVVFAHGNAELIDDQTAIVDGYRGLGLAVLLPEYRGYGRSAGLPSEEAIVGDAETFLALALQRPDVDPARVVFHGRSVGAGVACALALRRAPAALVLESAFRSVASMAWRFGVPSFLVRDPFDNEEALRSLDLPVLLFHGRRDSIVPFAHAEALRRAARRAVLVPYDCDHNDLPPDPDDYWRRVGDFLREAGVRP